jgi:hypothetical protein
MFNLISSITEEELRFIANLDYGVESELHYSELHSLIHNQAFNFTSDQYFHPYEVIELGTHVLLPGHEREFAICTLLVIHAVRSGYDKSTELDEKFSQRAADYDKLSPELSSIVLREFASFGF